MELRVNPDRQIEPRPLRSTGSGPPIKRSRFRTILPKVKDFVGKSPIVAHAYKKTAQISSDYEFARAKVIQWGESAYPLKSGTFARRSCSHSFSQAPVSRLPRCAIGVVLDSSERGTTGTEHCLTPT